MDYESQLPELTPSTIKDASVLRLLTEHLRSLTIMQGQGVRVGREAYGTTVSVDPKEEFEYQPGTDIITGISYDSATNEYTMTLRELSVVFTRPGVTQRYTTKIDATTFKYNDPVSSPNTIDIYLTNFHANEEPKYQWMSLADGYGVAGADATTNNVELVLHTPTSRRVARIQLVTGGSYTLFPDNSQLPEFDLNKESGISQPGLYYNESLKRLYLRQFGPTASRSSGTGSTGYWTGGSGAVTFLNIPVNTTSNVYYGFGFTETGTNGNLQLNATGLDTYMLIGNISTNSTGDLKALKDYSQEARFVCMGINDSFTIDTPRGTETLQFIDGILVSRT